MADPGRRDGETIRAKRMNMSEENAVVANFNTQTQVGTDVKESARSDFPMKRLSVVGKDQRIDALSVGLYTKGMVKTRSFNFL